MTAEAREGDDPTAADMGHVRFATHADAGVVADIQIRGWRAAYRGLVPDAILDGFDVDQRTTRWAELIKRARRDATRIWVVSAETGAAADDAPVLGFAMAGPARDESAPPPDGAGEIYAIYVDPDVIGSGCGRALFTAATGELLARGYDPIVVWVFEDNPRARRFYEAAGFRLDGARNTIDFDGTPIDEIRYHLVE